MNSGLPTALPPTAEETNAAICQLHLEICRLKQHLNTFCIIERLPNELLEYIFVCYLWAHIGPKLHAGSFIDLGQSDLGRPLKTLASVSSRWLSTVIRCPSLWSIIVCNPSSGAKTNLAKSGTGSLYIVGDSPTIYGIPDILKHTWRIREVYWQHDSESHGGFDPALIRRALAGPSSRLTEVVLDIPTGEDHTDDAVRLPADFFAGARSLLRLDLRICWFGRNVMCFPPRLRKLSLQPWVARHDIHPDIGSLLASVAEQCLELEQLRIDGGIDEDAFAVTSDEVWRVRFPRLRQIALAANNLNVLQILERIDRPACDLTVARMYFMRDGIQFDSAQALCPSDQTRERVTTLFVFSGHTDQRVVGRTGGMQWTGTRHEVCDTQLGFEFILPQLGESNATDVVFDLHMATGITITYDPERDAIESIAAYTPSIMAVGSSVTHIYVRWCNIRRWTQRTWEELLDCVPCLEALVVRNDCQWAIIECVSQGLFAALGETTSRVLIPRLKRLELVMGHKFSTEFAKEWAKELGACVIARKAAAAAGTEELLSITVSWKGWNELYLKGVLEDEVKTLVGDLEMYCVAYT